MQLKKKKPLIYFYNALMRKKIMLDSFIINIQDFLNIFRTFWELKIAKKKPYADSLWWLWTMAYCHDVSIFWIDKSFYVWNFVHKSLHGPVMKRALWSINFRTNANKRNQLWPQVIKYFYEGGIHTIAWSIWSFFETY